MVMYLGNVPTWFFDPTNKPDFEVFQNWLTAETEFQTLTPIDLNTVKVQGQFKNTELLNQYIGFFNIAKAKWGNKFLYFKVLNISQIQENQVVEIELELDIYLSFCVEYFDTKNNNIESKVFFKRKHLNRYIWYKKNDLTYNTQIIIPRDTNALDFKIQFWLNSIDKDLLALINDKTYNSYVKNELWQSNRCAYVGTNPKTNDYELNYDHYVNVTNWAWYPNNKNTPKPMTMNIYNFSDNDTNALYLFAVMKKNQAKASPFGLYDVYNDTSTEFWIPIINQSTINNPQIYIAGSTNPNEISFNNAIANVDSSSNSISIGAYYGNSEWATQTNFQGANIYSSWGISLKDFYNYVAKDTYMDIIAFPFNMFEITNNLITTSPNFYWVEGGITAMNGNFQGNGLKGLSPIQNYPLTDIWNASTFITEVSAPMWNTTLGMNMHSVSYCGYTFAVNNTPNTDTFINTTKLATVNKFSDPILFNEKFYEWKIKLGNIEQSVFLSDFQDICFNSINVPPNEALNQVGVFCSDVIFYMLNFRLNINYPNINITNCNIAEMEGQLYNEITYEGFTPPNTDNVFPTQTIILQSPYTNPNRNSIIATPYNLNLEQELLFNFEWRNTYPSLSNNWTNYLENNHNQYELGRNLGILGLTAGGLTAAMSAVPEFAVGSGAISGITTNGAKAITSSLGIDVLEGDISKRLNLNSTMGYDNYANLVNNNTYAYGKGNMMSALSGLTGLIGSAMNFAYLYGGGMKGDKQRVPTIQGSQSMNVYLNKSMQVMWKEEFLVPWAEKVVTQRYMLNGYQLERFASFKYWYNRIMWNYVEILNITTVLFQREKAVPLPIKNKIDDMFMRGVRIIHTYGIDGYEGGIAWGEWASNNEVDNTNNQEIWDVQ